MSLQTKLQNISTALTAVSGLSSFHYFAPSIATIPYAVWYEDGEAGSLQANNHKAEQALSGYVDYYTKTEYDATCDLIQAALNDVDGLSWTYESVIYGDPTHEDNNTIHHTWSWRIL